MTPQMRGGVLCFLGALAWIFGTILQVGTDDLLGDIAGIFLFVAGIPLVIVGGRTFRSDQDS
jgi:hypothetical protein